jgi:carboxyl-terminal processing protease
MRGKQTGRTATRLKTYWRNKNVRTVRNIAVLVGVLFLGINIGNGQLSLPSRGVVSNDLPATLNYTSVNQVYQSLKENYNGKLTEEQLIDGLKHGLAEATNDPYTSYFTPEEASSFNDSLQGQFSGIGAELGKDERGNIQVIAPISGTPAEKAGLQTKDVIATVNDKTTAGMSVDDAVQLIRGKAGTKVTLQVIRGGTEALTFTITRETIHLPTVVPKTLENNIGYVQVTTFGDDTAQKLHAEVLKFKQAGVKGIVLDLRNNPGGLVDAAVPIASEWVPSEKLILQQKRGNTVMQSYYSTGTNTVGNIPTVVLVNEGSASASEIVAAALKDNNKNVRIIGEKSYGKGVVQDIISFRDGSELKVTVAAWHRPNGQNIDKKGITPDEIVKISDEDAKAGNDTQLKAAEAYLNW